MAGVLGGDYKDRMADRSAIRGTARAGRHVLPLPQINFLSWPIGVPWGFHILPLEPLGTSVPQAPWFPLSKFLATPLSAVIVNFE